MIVLERCGWTSVALRGGSVLVVVRLLPIVVFHAVVVGWAATWGKIEWLGGG